MERVILRTHQYPGKGRIKAEAYVPEARSSDGYRVDLALADAHGQLLQRWEPLSVPRSGWVEAEFEASSLPAGGYVIQALVSSSRADELKQSAYVNWPEKPWWLGSEEGVTDEVLPPWTPLEVEADQDSVEARPWDRAYRFGGMHFLQAVEGAVGPLE